MIWVVHTSPIDLTYDPGLLAITIHINHHLSGLHSNIIQILLYWYTHRGDHSYQYFWVPGSMYVAYSDLILGTIYTTHSSEIYHCYRFICIYTLFCKQ